MTERSGGAGGETPKPGEGGKTPEPNGNPQQASGAEGGKTPEADDDQDRADYSPDKVKEILRDRKRAKDRLKVLEVEHAAANEKLAAHAKAEEDKRLAGLAEVERERELRVKAEAKAAEAVASAQKTQRMAALSMAGVDPEYTDVLEPKLAAALAADPKLDPAAWLQDQKVKKPAIFGAKPAEQAAGGPQRSGTTDPKIEDARARLKNALTVEDRYKAIRDLKALGVAV